MSIIGNNMLAGASGHGGYKIKRSLRFNDDDATYLYRTPGSAGNRKTWTWSGWVKRSRPDASSLEALFSSTTELSSGNSNTYMTFYQDNIYINSYNYPSGSAYTLTTTQVFRDSSAWYHIVWAVDTTQATSSNRIKLYVNGQQVTSFSAETYPSQNYEGLINSSSYKMTMGRAFPSLTNNSPFDGYMAEVNFVDGTALGPSDFGKTDSATGAWIPKKYSGTYGTNGFYLSLSDNSDVTATTLGRDSSGNSNNFTPDNFSVTAGAGNDSLEDTPTNNWCTWNPLAKDGGTTYSNGSLDISSANYGNNTATFFLTSGKWYWEGKGSGYVAAICGRAGQNATGSISTSGSNSIGYWEEGPVYWDGGNNSGTISYTSSDVIGTALDMDNGIVRFYKNGAFAYTIVFGSGTVPDLSDGVFPCYNNGASSTIRTAVYNFGQRAFDYTPPTGYKALNTANLPVPTVKNGTEYFNTALYTGDDSVGRAITVQDSAGNGWQPDFVWVKARNQAYSHHVYDSVRGASKRLLTNGTQAEFDQGSGDGVTAFNSNGFDVSHTSSDAVNQLNTTYAAFNWKAGGSGSANTDGTISSTVSVNADAGFSIVSYTGTGVSGTIGHGLNVTPSFVIIKKRSATAAWQVHGDGFERLELNSTGGELTNGFTLARTSTTISPTGNAATHTYWNENNATYIAYCFAEVEGYSKFGSYESNNNVDGPFVYTGFRPAFVIMKDIDRSGMTWILNDSTRDPFNPAGENFAVNGTSTDPYNTNSDIDILSNGFKLRGGSSSWNNYLTETYIYIAFAEMPFKYANAR